tara:strand:+ start:145 stop:513 length:369 start_codon:yes stop_codon:yes gene_type:complete
MPNFKVAIIPAGDGPVSIHDIKGEDGVSFETIYPLIDANLIEITQGKWNDIKENIVFDCDLYCDEEAKLTGKPHNWRASQLRYNKLKSMEGQLMDNWRDYAMINGDVAMVVEDNPDLQWETQ